MTCNLSTYTCFPEESDLGPGLDLTVDLGGDVFKGKSTGSTCQDKTECQSGFCADGFCCNKACTGTCESCKLSGTEGTCTWIPTGTDPDSECMGTLACGGDMCDGKGACTTYKPSGTMVGNSCSDVLGSEHLMHYYECDGQGAYGSTIKKKDCSPYLCDKTLNGGSCPTGCLKHEACISTSVCDRQQAHKTGKGICVNPAKVVMVATTADLQTQVTASAQSSFAYSHIVLKTGTYATNLVFSGAYPVTLVGLDKVTLQPPASGGTSYLIEVKDGATVVLQGLNLLSSKSDGLYCTGLSYQKTTLDLLDSTIKSSVGTGITTSNCTLTLRRSRIQNNASGGLFLEDGNVTLVNNVITKNGSTSSSFGGLAIVSSSGYTVTFAHNTVAENKSSWINFSGIKCTLVSQTLQDSIVWSTEQTPTTAITSLCKFNYSNVQGLSSGSSGNISTDPTLSATYSLKSGSPCIDAGTDSNQTVLDIDLNTRPAVAGGIVDIGAYEVQ